MVHKNYSSRKRWDLSARPCHNGIRREFSLFWGLWTVQHWNIPIPYRLCVRNFALYDGNSFYAHTVPEFDINWLVLCKGHIRVALKGSDIGIHSYSDSRGWGQWKYWGRLALFLVSRHSWTPLRCTRSREFFPSGAQKHLLWGLLLLKVYLEEAVNEIICGVYCKTVRRWDWLKISEIAPLSLVSEKRKHLTFTLTYLAHNAYSVGLLVFIRSSPRPTGHIYICGRHRHTHFKSLNSLTQSFIPIE